MNLLLINMLIGIANISLIEVNSRMVQDPVDLMNTLQDNIDSTKDEKTKESMLNLANFAFDDPMRFRMLIYVMMFIPIINIILLIVNIKMYYKEK